MPAEAHLWLESPLAFDSPEEPYRTDYFPYGADREPFRLHHGTDFPKPAGTPARATADSIVVVAGNDRETVYGARSDFYGNLVILELDERFLGQAVYVLYGHLQEVSVKAGQHVRAGDLVGLVGGTGAAYGASHLHLEVRLGENRYESTRNPVLWLKPEPGYGVIAGVILDVQGHRVATVPVSFFRAEAPGKWWREVLSYANQEVNPDDVLGENFALGFVPAGEYLVKVKIGERSYVRPVSVQSGSVAFVTIQAEK